MISKFFIERPIFANVIAIVTIIMGMVCFYRLPVAQYPPIVPPTIQVSARYPGASAEVVAATVGIPIEQAVNGVEDSIYMSSTSGSDGSYTLTVTFDVGTDLNTSVALVQNLVTSAMAQLPPAVQSQGVQVKKVSTDILLVVSLFSANNKFDEAFLSNYAVINLQNPLARLPGVGKVYISGAGPYAMRVWLDPKKLLSGLQFDHPGRGQLPSSGQNVQVVAGQMGGPPAPADQVFQFTVNALGRLVRRRGIRGYHRQEPSGAQSAQIVRIRDVARVELSQQTYANFHPARPAIWPPRLSSSPCQGPTPWTSPKRCRQAMADMSKRFPPGLTWSSPITTPPSLWNRLFMMFT